MYFIYTFTLAASLSRHEKICALVSLAKLFCNHL